MGWSKGEDVGETDEGMVTGLGRSLRGEEEEEDV